MSAVFQARALSLVVTDFDGVLTDNTVLISDAGTEFVRCSKADGVGISILRELGVRCLVLSAEENLVIVKRCKKLGISVISGVSGSKAKRLGEFLKNEGLDWSRVCYIGNDLADQECIANAAFGVVVKDFLGNIDVDADFCLLKNEGCLRDLADLIAQLLGERQ